MTTAGSRRVLIADDSLDSSEPLAVLLSMEGCDVRTCARGCDVLPMAVEYRPHLILLDWVFHGANTGVELLGQLRRHETTARTVIAILSGRADRKTQDEARQSGADFYFVKPLDPEGLLDFAVKIDRRSLAASPDAVEPDRRVGASPASMYVRSRFDARGFSAARTSPTRLGTSVVPQPAGLESARASPARRSHRPS